MVGRHHGDARRSRPRNRRRLEREPDRPRAQLADGLYGPPDARDAECPPPPLAAPRRGGPLRGGDRTGVAGGAGYPPGAPARPPQAPPRLGPRVRLRRRRRERPGQGSGQGPPGVRAGPLHPAPLPEAAPAVQDASAAFGDTIRPKTKKAKQPIGIAALKKTLIAQGVKLSSKRRADGRRTPTLDREARRVLLASHPQLESLERYFSAVDTLSDCYHKKIISVDGRVHPHWSGFLRAWGGGV